MPAVVVVGLGRIRESRHLAFRQAGIEGGSEADWIATLRAVSTANPITALMNSTAPPAVSAFSPVEGAQQCLSHAIDERKYRVPTNT